MAKEIDDNTFPEVAETARLQRENDTLAQQVKRLIKAESKLYDYQEKLDAQLKEYKELYQLSRKINATVDIRKVFEFSCEYIIRNLGYERVIFSSSSSIRANMPSAPLTGITISRKKAALRNSFLKKMTLSCHPCRREPII